MTAFIQAPRSSKGICEIAELRGSDCKPSGRRCASHKSGKGLCLRFSNTSIFPLQLSYRQNASYPNFHSRQMSPYPI